MSNPLWSAIEQGWTSKLPGEDGIDCQQKAMAAIRSVRVRDIYKAIEGELVEIQRICLERPHAAKC